MKIHNVSLKIKKKELKREQFQQKRIFRTNASQFSNKLNGTGNKENISPEPDQAIFWSDIWSVPSTHNQDARWLQRMRQGLADVEKQEDIKITVK